MSYKPVYSLLYFMHHPIIALIKSSISELKFQDKILCEKLSGLYTQENHIRNFMINAN